MNRFLFSFLLYSIIATELLHAQEEDYLKTTIVTTQGDEINGYVKLDSLPSRITLFYPSGDSLILDTKLVQSIRIFKDKYIRIPSEINKNSGNGHPKLKYFNNSFFGILLGKSNADSPQSSYLSIEMINGIIIYRFLALGAGIAYDRYNTTSVLPLFISIRGDVSDKSFTPFYYVDAGFSTSWDSREDENNWNSLDTEGGFTFHTGGGLKMYSGTRINIMIAIGYKYQKVAYNTVMWDGNLRVDDRKFNRLSLRIGIGF